MFFDDSLFGSPQWTIAVKLLLAALAGALVGIEREKHGRPAGLRTHLLVALACCLMMIISESFYLKYGALAGTGVVRIDPSRIAAQIVAGIGFIGAGVILKEGLTVRGLTTAACLWLAAGLGMGFGIGVYLPTMMAAVIGLSGLVLLKKLEPYIKKDRYLFVTVAVGGGRDVYPELEAIFVARKMRISDVAGEFDAASGDTRYDFILTQHQQRMGRELVTAISAIPEVRRINFR